MQHPIAIAGIDHIVLRVRDRASATAFYRDILGLAVEWDRPDLGMTHMRAGPQLIDLVSADGPLGLTGGPAPGRDGHNLEHVCLQVSPFDEAAIRAHLARHGVEIVDSGPRYGADGWGVS